MSDVIYSNLAKVLDALPNGFPATKEGVEIKLLKKVFEPDEAELFCELKLNEENADQIAERTGRDINGLYEKLIDMWGKGQIFAENTGNGMVFKMIPWIVGIYEFQINRMDKEFAELHREYKKTLGLNLLVNKPQIMKAVSIEEKIPAKNKVLHFKTVSSIIEKGQSFLVNQCICKKEAGLVGKTCKKPQEVCLGISIKSGYFDNHPLGGRIISKDEAYQILKKSEDAGLVHLTSNIQNADFDFICNCCDCCCGVIIGTKLGIPKAINSDFYAIIDMENCSGCGICFDERCQIAAIDKVDDKYQVNVKKCIGCGLCVTTCSSDAITLQQREQNEIIPSPDTEMDWYKTRGDKRGIDFSKYL